MARAWWDAGADPPTYHLTRAVFLRALGAVYAVAFASLGVQIVGLVGEQGILPATEYLEEAHRVAGARAYWLLPTLCWLAVGDLALQLLSWTGFALALLLMAGVAPALTLLALWLLYLSLSVAGQVFLGYQWDTLLLETGLLAVFFAPGAPAASRWMLWLLLFKLMFLSGITKIVSGDPTWADGTALLFHYETQPIPTWTSWYFHHLPAWMHAVSLAFMWLAELVAPFAIFAPARVRWLRWAGCAVMIAFQLMLVLTGNYGFFNWLTIVLCLALVDDGVWRRVLPARWTGGAPPAATRLARGVAIGAAALLLPLSAIAFAREIAFTAPRSPGDGRPLAWSDPIAAWTRPFRSVNGYGLFRVMTTERPEVALEARRTGEEEWTEVPFRWKAGDPSRSPGFVAPHMPRLDWQMWFAGLSPGRHRYWLLPLAQRVLEGSPAVTGLLAPGAIAQAPPDEVRLVLYRYHFTGWDEGRETGDWWERVNLGPLTPPMTRETPD